MMLMPHFEIFMIKGLYSQEANKSDFLKIFLWSHILIYICIIATLHYSKTILIVDGEGQPLTI